MIWDINRTMKPEWKKTGIGMKMNLSEWRYNILKR